MTTKWTDEKWEIEDRRDVLPGLKTVSIVCRFSETDALIAPLVSPENASRIVSCKEAMVGIEDPKAFREAAEELFAMAKLALPEVYQLWAPEGALQYHEALTRFEAARKGEKS